MSKNGLFVLFFITKLDVDCGVSGVHMVRQIPHLALLCEFITVPKRFAFSRHFGNSVLLQSFYEQTCQEWGNWAPHSGSELLLIYDAHE